MEQNGTLIIWLTPEQAAARAQVGKRTVYHEVNAGRLRAARVGGRRELRIKPEWIDSWLEQSATPIEVKA
jgi:excisionase family DNA binding protein